MSTFFKLKKKQICHESGMEQEKGMRRICAL